jgi:hypothetical protein
MNPNVPSFKPPLFVKLNVINGSSEKHATKKKAYQVLIEKNINDSFKTDVSKTQQYRKKAFDTISNAIQKSNLSEQDKIYTMNKLKTLLTAKLSYHQNNDKTKKITQPMNKVSQFLPGIDLKNLGITSTSNYIIAKKQFDKKQLSTFEKKNLHKTYTQKLEMSTNLNLDLFAILSLSTILHPENRIQTSQLANFILNYLEDHSQNQIKFEHNLQKMLMNIKKLPFKINLLSEILKDINRRIRYNRPFYTQISNQKYMTMFKNEIGSLLPIVQQQDKKRVNDLFIFLINNNQGLRTQLLQYRNSRDLINNL